VVYRYMHMNIVFIMYLNKISLMERAVLSEQPSSDVALRIQYV
jgi:hypothetical protein